MKSRSKYILDDVTIKKAFEKAGILNVSNIRELSAGEFNSVYAVEADALKYVLKVAPKDENVTLTYEKDMMEMEVAHYSRMREAGIRVPKVYYSNFSCSDVPTKYFIMEKLDGVQLDKAGLNASQRSEAEEKLIQMASRLHTVSGDGFGYVQNGLHSDWYSAIASMTRSLLCDSERYGKKSKRGKRLLGYIECFKDELNRADCCLVNFDIWEPNVFVLDKDPLSLAWIDPERCFYGDRIADFICLGGLLPVFDKKARAFGIYNDFSAVKIETTDNARIRFGVMSAYLGLISETEKYARYSPLHFGWWRNVFTAKTYFDAGFLILKRLEKRQNV